MCDTSATLDLLVRTDIPLVVIAQGQKDLEGIDLTTACAAMDPAGIGVQLGLSMRTPLHLLFDKGLVLILVRWKQGDDFAVAHAATP